MVVESIYAGENVPKRKIFDVNIHHLREALLEVSDIVWIDNVPRVGYRLRLKEKK
jgi:DNA-binding winged helix-turn-helix (wHTH) protein